MRLGPGLHLRLGSWRSEVALWFMNIVWDDGIDLILEALAARPTRLSTGDDSSLDNLLERGNMALAAGAKSIALTPEQHATFARGQRQLDGADALWNTVRGADG